MLPWQSWKNPPITHAMGVVTDKHAKGKVLDRRTDVWTGPVKFLGALTKVDEGK